MKIQIANALPGGNQVTSLKNALRFVRRGIARMDEAERLVFLPEYVSDRRVAVIPGKSLPFGCEVKPELSLGAQIAEYTLFRDRAFRWRSQPSDGVLVVQAHGGVSQAALKRATG